MSSKDKAARPEADPANDEILWVGIDLGTSRTAIAASNGIRESTFSLVGYPRDVVSRKLLQKDALFGEEVLKHRLALDVYRPLEKGVIKFSDDNGRASDDKAAQGNARAAKDLVKHAIALARPRADQLIYAVIGCPAQCSIHNKKAIVDAAREVVDAVMITSEPFTVAYGLERLADCLVVDIGAGTTDLCRMHGTMPADEDQLTVPLAGDHIDRTLAEAVRRKHPQVAFSERMATEAKETHANVGQDAGRVVVRWPVNGKPTDIDISDEMRQACLSLVPPIAESIQKLVASFDPEFQERLRGNVLLGGGGSQIRGLGWALSRYMDEHLGGGHVTTVEEPVYAGANGALKIARDMPAEYWEQMS